MNDGRIAPGYAGPATGEKTAMTAITPPVMQPLVRKAAVLAINGMYEPGQYVRSADLRAGKLHDDGQGGAWFYAETDEPATGTERVRVTIAPA
jgi:hypothetical protein